VVHHDGVDLAAAEGTRIRAAAAGVVASAVVEFGDEPRGRRVVLEHAGGCATYYGHLGDVLVSEGEHVEQGQVIATVGTTGLSTGPHLHFEVRVGGEPQPPRFGPASAAQ
jgi:murein DD-endopeptidase MepM/ murein hydrolase activator NlpD